MMTIPWLTNAQITLERQVIGTAGTHQIYAAGQLSSTTGELIVNTSIQGNFMLTQGFQQPEKEDFAVGTTSVNNLQVNYQLFPNPATDQLNIDLQTDGRVELTLTLFNLEGRKIKVQSIDIQSVAKEKWDISNLPTGQYYLNFSGLKNQNFQTEKIQIVH